MTRGEEPELSDDDLIGLARAGDDAAFDELWRRHSRSATRIARQFASGSAADGIVDEARTAIHGRILAGGGPSAGFRPYLYATIRGSATVDGTAATDDGATLDRALTARAYRSLPERWQTALWYAEVERIDPAEIAPVLGMTPQAAEALVFRAREGLRSAWLREHAADASVSADCRWAIHRLGGELAANLSATDRMRRDDHVDGCARCTVLAEQVDGVGSRLALAVAPVIVGGVAVGAVAASTATAGAAAAVGATAAGSSIAAPALVGTLAAVALVGGSVVLAPPPAAAPDPHPTVVSSTTVADRTPARAEPRPTEAPRTPPVVPISDPVSTSIPTPPPVVEPADGPAVPAVADPKGTASSGSGSHGSGSSGSGSGNSGSNNSGSNNSGSNNSGSSGSGSHGSGSSNSGSSGSHGSGSNGSSGSGGSGSSGKGSSGTGSSGKGSNGSGSTTSGSNGNGSGDDEDDE